MIDAATRERIEANFTAFFEGDLDGAVAIMAPDVVAHDSPEMPDAGTLHGRDELKARLAGFREIFDELELEQLDIHELDEHVLVVIRIHGSARMTRLPLDQELAYVCDMRDGLVAEMHVFFAEADARTFASG